MEEVKRVASSGGVYRPGALPAIFLFEKNGIKIMKKHEKDHHRKIAILGIGIIFVLMVLASYYFPKGQKTKELTPLTNVTSPNKTSEVELYIPAVSNEGKGVVTLLRVESLPGKGRVLVNVNNLLFWVDTQQSIRIAKNVAQKVTGVNLSNYDLIYSIESNATLVEGPSAGAAIAIATIASLEGKKINSSVMITGTINPDGSIGPVSGIIPKAKAAKAVGAKVFLVPKGQSVQINYVPEEKCEKIGSITFCTTTYKEEKENVGKVVGIKVVEVSTIYEALKYFFG